MFSVPKKDLKMKDRADLLEAFIGALYVDKDLVIDSTGFIFCFFFYSDITINDLQVISKCLCHHIFSQEYCRVFAEVCFFPRLQHFIINQEWNDPKSKLQQCCLTLRAMNGHDPDIPVYKVRSKDKNNQYYPLSTVLLVAHI